MNETLLDRTYSYRIKFQNDIYKVNLDFNKFKLDTKLKIIYENKLNIFTSVSDNKKEVDRILNYFSIQHNNFISKRLKIINQFEGKVQKPNMLVSNESLILGCKTLDDVKIFNKLTIYNIVNHECNIVLSLVERQLYLNSLKKKVSNTSILVLSSYNNVFQKYMSKLFKEDVSNDITSK